MPVVVNLLKIPKEETLAPMQTIEERPITNTQNTADMKMVNMMMAVEAWTLQLSNPNDLRYWVYQTASTYATQADHPPPHTPINFPPSNAAKGPASNCQWPYYQQYPEQGLLPCIKCDESQHIRTFLPDGRTDWNNGIVYLNECGRPSSSPTGDNRSQISGYWPERWFLTMQEYTWEVAWLGQQGWGVATTAAP